MITFCINSLKNFKIVIHPFNHKTQILNIQNQKNQIVMLWTTAKHFLHKLQVSEHLHYIVLPLFNIAMEI